MRNVCLRIHGLALILVALMGVASEASGQTTQVLMQFTNTWRYDQSGRDLLGTLWRTNTYVEDASWQPLSRGLLGFEPDTPNVYTIHAPITTPLSVSSTVTSYYFRTTFQFTGSTNGVTLISSNLVDDGCAIYLNGLQAGLVRLAANPSATVLASGGTEGALDVVNISPGLLRQGANLFAVEVHQSSVGSSDVMFGMKLVAISPTALTITNQPVGDTIAVGDTVTLTAGVSGGPVFYQWRKDGVNISNGGNVSGANTNALRIVNAQLNNAGTYTLVVTNLVTPFLQSSPAVLTVVEDTTGPKLVSAVIRETGATNQIVIQFSETVQSGLVANSTSTNLANFRITQCGTANTVTITNATQGGSQIQLRVSGPNWNPTNCYYLTVNIVADSRGNQINPNSIVGLSTTIITNLVQMSDDWDYFDSSFLEPNIYTEQWYRTNYVISQNWGTGGEGILWFDNATTGQPCAGDALGRSISFQEEPTLFRRTFKLPAGYGQDATLRLRHMIDDGLLLYLNGILVYSNNMPAGPYTATTKALTTVVNPTCVTNLSLSVSNLLPGTNWLAAGVYQGPVSESDTYFGLEFDLVTLKTSPVPTNSINKPTIVRAVQRVPLATNMVLSWPATHYGYALRYSTNIVGKTPTEITNWFTNDIYWTQVKDQSNPYSNAIPPTTGPRRFYQLFHENPRK